MKHRVRIREIVLLEVLVDGPAPTNPADWVRVAEERGGDPVLIGRQEEVVSVDEEG